MEVTTQTGKQSTTRALLFDVFLVLVLLVGAYFRLVGINWGEYQHLHPDERFLIWVGTDIQPANSWSEYFDTANSTLNPNNRGHMFYVYGTLPMFLTRYLVEWVYGHSGFNEMANIGRPLSAMFDLLTVFLVYLIAARLYNRRVGILAAILSAATVLQIQQSHFFTMDTFFNFFTYLAIYFAVRVAKEKQTVWGEQTGNSSNPGESIVVGEKLAVDGQVGLKQAAVSFIRNPNFILSIGFGVALGAAVASKISAFPVAVMLPAAFALQIYPLSSSERQQRLVQVFVYLVLAAVVSLFFFRIFQPYAFSGPGFLGLRPNPQWVNNILEQRNQAAGDVDFPPALQWARRPIWFSGMNIVLWGLGLPFGVLAWAGFLWVGWRMLTRKSEWQNHVLLWGWTAFYFVWQSIQFNPTMRYQLPVYPALAIYAGWAIVALYDLGSQSMSRWRTGSSEGEKPPKGHWARIVAFLVGGVVIVATLAWAYGFTRVYARPITRVEASRWIFQNIPGPINLPIQTEEGAYNQLLPFPYTNSVQPDQPYLITFIPQASGTLSEIYIPHAVDMNVDPRPKVLTLTIGVSDHPDPLAKSEVISNFDRRDDPRGQAYVFSLDQPVAVAEGQQYTLTIALEGGAGAIDFAGAAVANEGDWDDGLPVRLEGYDAFGGIYEPGLNFNMYTDDNPDKLARFLDVLERADYIFISSSRQWGSLPRLPERFPMTTVYYRDLLGCPSEQSIEHCYNVARPGLFQGKLGFELVQIFQSDPQVGPQRINDQPSEEAFTVYDHPKVFIFRKTEDYNPQQVAEILGSVDLTQVVRVTPKQADSHPANLMLPSDRLAEQRSSGTWLELFNPQSLINRSQLVSVIVWYLSLTLLGLIAYPIVRIAFPGLADHGYPLARLAGLLLLSYLVWLAGSAHIPFNRTMISAVFLVLVSVSSGLIFYQRQELSKEWRSRRKYYLMVEALFLLFFITDLLIRYGNPDLWHPWKGGEKPMDFSYLNAVLKSISFPPYDPWYAGGYLNYYYYGFVLVGVLIKWLGIVPSVAYNLVIPSIFAMIAMGAFSLAWNLYSFRTPESEQQKNPVSPQPLQVQQNDSGVPPRAAVGQESLKIGGIQIGVGLAGALGMAVLGNLGTVRMIWQGYQRIAAPGGVIEGANIFTQLIWFVQGFIKAMTGTPLPYGIGDWYWIPSRAIPAPGDVEPITEFPLFTVLYGDPHAHLFALPITLLALAFALSIVLGRARWKGVLGGVTGFFLGGLAIGALRPTNTWDFYPYLALGCIAVVYALWRYYQPLSADQPASNRVQVQFARLPEISQRILVTLGGLLLLVFLSTILFQPYLNWYGLGYGKIDLWKGTHTPLGSYLVHWGLFLFVIVSWMAWETREWMASTPLSALRKLEPYKLGIQLVVVLLFIVIGALLWLHIHIAWFVLPLAAWTGVLALHPKLPDNKRFVLFLVGTGLVLTLMVETIVLRGDIGRMNTVFKFYLQVWTMFAISAAPALGWVWRRVPAWNPNWRTAWQFALTVLVAAVALNPMLATLAKVKDRMAPQAPHTLDGMTFMDYAEYADVWGTMDLSQDYRAIRWMQENVPASPVIVEANLRDLYRWGSRYSIYTGLPGVVGWEWHQQQQRALLPGNWVSDRIAEIDGFYQTTDLAIARDFLQKYDIRYIVVGQQERGHYPGEGLEKFPAAEGALWRKVYEEGDTVIYEVLSSPLS